ncbi:MAG TPA: hypothetical protein VFB30_08750 [Spirochaetia bacterium]|nr:hypothetical protein [Spirochaetia bacterium]
MHIVEISNAIGMYEYDPDAKHWEPPQEPQPVRYVLLQQGSEAKGRWNNVGIVVFNASAYQSAFQIDGLACDRLEIQNLEALERAGHDIKGGGSYVTRVHLAQWAERMQHYGDVERNWEYPLHLKRIGDEVIWVSPFIDADDPRTAELPPRWRQLVEAARSQGAGIRGQESGGRNQEAGIIADP